MRPFIVVAAIMITSLAATAQSKSFSTLKGKFSGAEDVSSVKVGGFILRTILWMADETDWKDEFGEVKSVRVINIPQREFRRRKVSTAGFKKVLARDNFEELATTYDDGERLSVFMQDRQKQSDVYFLLVENDQEVTAIEIKGSIDAQKIVKTHQKHNHVTL